MRVLIIGGSDAGISAGLRIGELDPAVEVAILYRDRYPNFSVCGLPYFLGGEVEGFSSLAHRSPAELAARGLELYPEHEALSLDPSRRRVLARGPAGEREFSYDRLLLATGSRPYRPPWPGLGEPGVHFLHTPGDGLRLAEDLAERGPRRAVVLGGGYTALEMAEALLRRGLEVEMVIRGERLLRPVDEPFGRALAERLVREGGRLRTRSAIRAVEKHGPGLSVRGEGWELPTDLVLVATGVRPESRLAAAAGIEVERSGAVRVDRFLRTSVPEIFAAGDLTESYHRILERTVYLPLGTIAHKEGRLAAENILGFEKPFPGIVGTQVLKFFDLALARTGLGREEAEREGLLPEVRDVTAWTHNSYYPGAEELRIRLTSEARTDRLLGAQILGPAGADVAKRIDTVAAALYAGLSREELLHLDMAYAPPFSAPWDPLQAAAQVARDSANDRG